MSSLRENGIPSPGEGRDSYPFAKENIHAIPLHAPSPPGLLHFEHKALEIFSFGQVEDDWMVGSGATAL